MGHAMRLHEAARPQGARAPGVATKNSPSAGTAARSPMVALQQSVGNRAVGRLVQAKLKVGRPGDRLEREANRVAGQVTRMPEPQLQRACACGGDCPRCQAEQPGREPVTLRTRRVPASDTARVAAPPGVDEALRSPGRPLEPAMRAFMEPRFGCNFSEVRVHSGAAAERSAEGVNAHAYTVEHDIVLGTSAFTPGTDQGRRLIAHELTHVVQQSGSDAVRVDPSHKIRGQGTIPGADAKAPGPRVSTGAGRAVQREFKPAKPPDEIQISNEYVGKVAVNDPAEAARIRLRRTRTLRFFDKVTDHRLEEAYITRLQRYLDEGLEANDYWDAEMIEQIIQERAPNAPWHKKAQDEFLARLQVKLQEQARQKRLPTLSPYWQNQMGALSEQIAGRPGGARDLARDLLWKWLELQKQGRSTDVIEGTIIDDIASQFEEVLRAADQANQAYCRSRSPGLIEKLGRIHGDPCEPWFEKSHQRGYSQLRIFKLLLRTYRDRDGVPYRSIKFWIEEYMKQHRLLTDPKAQLELLQAQALASALGGVAGRFGTAGSGLAAQRQGAALRGLYPLRGRVTPVLQAPRPGPGARAVPESVGDIVTSPVLVGPQRVVAVKSGGVTVLEPVVRQPGHRRALPEPPKPAASRSPANPPPANRALPEPAPPPAAMPAITAAKRPIGFQPPNAPPPAPAPATKPPKRAIGFKLPSAKPAAPVSTDVPPPLSPRVGGFGRAAEPATPRGPAPPEPPVVTQMPPARRMPSSSSGQGVAGSVPRAATGQRRDQPARATAEKPKPEPPKQQTPESQPARAAEPSKSATPAQAAPQRLLPEQMTKGMEVDPTKHQVFRGGKNFTLKPGETKLDSSGRVQPTHGPSLDVNSATVQKFGGAYQIKSIPPELKIVQRGGRMPHCEVVPREPMPEPKFQGLLKQIEFY